MVNWTPCELLSNHSHCVASDESELTLRRILRVELCDVLLNPLEIPYEDLFHVLIPGGTAFYRVGCHGQQICKREDMSFDRFVLRICPCEINRCTQVLLESLDYLGTNPSHDRGDGTIATVLYSTYDVSGNRFLDVVIDRPSEEFPSIDLDLWKPYL